MYTDDGVDDGASPGSDAAWEQHVIRRLMLLTKFRTLSIPRYLTRCSRDNTKWVRIPPLPIERVIKREYERLGLDKKL